MPLETQDLAAAGTCPFQCLAVNGYFDGPAAGVVVFSRNFGEPGQTVVDRDPFQAPLGALTKGGQTKCTNRDNDKCCNSQILHDTYSPFRLDKFFRLVFAALQYVNVPIRKTFQT